MKLPVLKTFARCLCVLGLLGGSVSSFALDREAFSFTNYDLNLLIDSEQHRLGARGKVTLRNDTSTPQQVVVLQISSSLNWRAIKLGDKPLQFVAQPFASDIDHTGGLSEAIVTLPQPVAPHATVNLEIAYEGLIELDATRLTRIDTPEDAAKSSDWDQIAPNFTAVRGAGHVAWYPVATDVANLSEDDSLFEVLARWKVREASATFHAKFEVPRDSGDRPQELVVNEASCLASREEISRAQPITSDCTFQPLRSLIPSFVIADYGVVDRHSITVLNLPSHAVAAEAYADAGERLVPLISDWFGPPREKIRIADLSAPGDAPFESGVLLLTSLANPDSTHAGLVVAHQLTHASFSSPRPWIHEGLAHFAQALYLEHEKGRQVALDYMGAHRSALSQTEVSDLPRPEVATNNSLVNTLNEEFYRAKAMCVWWMLRDMVGDAGLKKAIAAYRPEQDKDPSYMPRLIASETQRDLEWFFDDWVYRDRGLPDFKVESAFPRKAMNNSFLLAVTVENLGSAGAEVPLTVRFPGGQVTKRLEVHAKDKATIRIGTPAVPEEVVVNDGSVPESGAAIHTYKVDAPKD
jgi:hypothetical protein